MTLKLGSTRLRAHPLALLLPAVAATLGLREEIIALLIGLTIHEAAHLIAARCLGVGVSQLRLMPFGGALTLNNPYALPASRLFAVASAGPVGNLLAIVTGAALAHWRLLSPAPALALLRANATLMLFNLLPALPLDGGRMLYALLFPRIGRDRAVEWGLRLGHGIAAALIGLAIYWAARLGRFNLSPLFAAIFILSSASDERNALSTVRLDTLLRQLRPIGEPLPARLCAVSAECSVQRALRAARPDALTLYAVYRGSRLISFTDDRRLQEAWIARSENARVGEI